MESSDLTNQQPSEQPQTELSKEWLLWLGVIFFVYLLLLGVADIEEGFQWISGGTAGAKRIFAFASNPIVGVILGVLATAIVQSSSTVTSVLVALVAGGLPVSYAVPMVMGANMGTTITNTLVSLGNIGQDQAFKRSFAAATVHDFFNLYNIFIFLPLEIAFHPLERSAGYLANLFVGGKNASIKSVNFVAQLTDPVAEFTRELFAYIPGKAGAILMTIFGIFLIMTSVIYLGKLLRKVMTGRAKQVLDKALGRGPLVGIIAGTIITVLVQSSSTTTSLIVPLAGAGVLTLQQVFPFTMGANIGTTITAMLAATAITGDTRTVALQIAIVHLLYNLAGVILFTLVPFLYNLPIKSAEWLGKKSAEHRGWAFGYIALIFLVLPGLVFLTQKSDTGTEQIDVKIEEEVKESDFELE